MFARDAHADAITVEFGEGDAANRKLLARAALGESCEKTCLPLPRTRSCQLVGDERLGRLHRVSWSHRVACSMGCIPHPHCARELAKGVTRDEGSHATGKLHPAPLSPSTATSLAFTS